MRKQIASIMRPQALAAVGSFFLLLTSCSTQNQEGTNMREERTAFDENVGGEPLRNLNPSPQKGYDIRIVLKDPPGPFAEINAAAQYDVVNAGECGEPQPLSGAVPRISTSEAVKLERVSDTEFVGRVFADRVLDEDYYGRGVCRWDFVEARVGFRAENDPMASWFVATLQADAIENGSEKSTFFWSGHYPHAEIDNYSTIGHAALDHVDAADRDEFFEVEMSAQQAQP